MRIVIVGGGIGGLAAALALARPDREITILERRTGFGESGAGIQLSPNATHALDRLGIAAALRRTACEPDGIVVRSLEAGQEIGRIGLGLAMRERFGAPYLAIARADLHTALLDAVRARGDIRLRLGRTATGCSPGDSGVRVALAGGHAEAEIEADLVVGADGLGSRMRASAGDARPPRPSGHAAFRTVLAATDLPAGIGGGWGGLWLGRGRHVVHYAVGAGAQVNVVVVAEAPEALEGWSAAVTPDRVRTALGAVPPRLRDLIARGRDWSAWSLHDLPVRTMGRGRLALLGDAAHPVLPYLAQGGGLAIEDAVSLGSHLGEDVTDVSAAVRFYARERLPRVRQVQTAARRNARAYHAGWPVSAIRDRVMARLGPDGMTDRYRWLYGWRPPAP